MSTATSKQSRKIVTQESIAAAVESITSAGMGLREASHVYNIPVETLRQRVHGFVEINCKRGPSTVLTDEEEDRLAKYLVEMADVGYGLNRETVMKMAFKIAEASHRKHPFKGETAGRAWMDGFHRHHPNLTIRSPQSLSHCRALCSNRDIIDDFFGKLGGLYGKLNLAAKPMRKCSTVTRLG